MVLPSSNKFMDFTLGKLPWGWESGRDTWNRQTAPDRLHFKAISPSPYFLLFFYSALQALCFIFLIASPEINQSNTCSRPLGLWRRPSTLLAVPRIHSGAVLVERYVLAGLSYHEGKTIIVFFFFLSLSFFSFSP